MWRKCCFIQTRNYFLLPAMLAILITQAGCPPAPVYLRTRTIELPAPVRIEPVIVEHMEEHVTYNSRYRTYRHSFKTTHYTLKISDGREMNVFVGDSPYVVIRNPANNERIPLGVWSRWSDPNMVLRLPPQRPATRPATPTTQGVTQ